MAGQNALVSGDATFPIFRVSPWDGGMSDGVTSCSGLTLFDLTSGTPTPTSSTRGAMSSSSHRHHREPDNGEFIVITSKRPDDEAESDAEFHSIEGMLVAVLEDEIGHDAPDGAWERRMREFRDGLAEGHIPIKRSTMRVDGTDVEFQMVNIGQCSTAWMLLDTVMIQMWSRRVSLDGLRLVSDSDHQHATTAVPRTPLST